jgi:hypothetical protein
MIWARAAAWQRATLDRAWRQAYNDSRHPHERSHMQSAHPKNMHAATLGSLGGYRCKERLTPQERSAISRHTAKAHWHPHEAQAIREKAEEITRLVKQALKDSNRM